VDQLMLGLRLVFSLAVVLAMMWGLSRVMRGGRKPVKGQHARLDVVARTSLGKHNSVIVLRAGDRGLIVGVTDHAISVLGEMELPAEEIVAEVRTPLEITADGAVTDTPATTIPSGRRRHAASEQAQTTTLSGSVLSPTTWRQTATAFRERTVRS
jgi:flagellar protein FliO/FliZ